MMSQSNQHFDKLSDHWWQVNGKLWTLHAINPLRMQFINERVDLSNKVVLDVGTGGGILAESLAVAKAQVLGIDLSVSAIQVAQQHAQQMQLPIDYQCRSLESLLGDAQQSFDIICCVEVLEHVQDPQQMMQQLAQLLKPSGSLFVSTLNRNIKSWFLSILVAEKLLGWLPEGTHNHGNYIKPSELAAMARHNRLNLLDSMGIIWNPLRAQFELHETDLDVNYIMYLQKQ